MGLIFRTSQFWYSPEFKEKLGFARVKKQKCQRAAGRSVAAIAPDSLGGNRGGEGKWDQSETLLLLCCRVLKNLSWSPSECKRYLWIWKHPVCQWERVGIEVTPQPNAKESLRYGGVHIDSFNLSGN